HPYLVGGGTPQAHWRNLLRRMQLKDTAECQSCV
uniref:Uncharacterized protein n=1 Tax=Aegilops tauschii subsp. strangulata TaxID=200361 RepID=A0A453R7D8_AEGTS